MNIINKEHNKVEKLLESLAKADNGKHVTAISSTEFEFIKVEQKKNNSFKYIEEDDVYELYSNGTITGIMMVEAGDGKVNFFCQCGWETDHTPKDYTPKNVVEETFYYIVLLIEHFSSRFVALN